MALPHVRRGLGPRDVVYDAAGRPHHVRFRSGAGSGALLITPLDDGIHQLGSYPVFVQGQLRAVVDEEQGRVRHARLVALRHDEEAQVDLLQQRRTRVGQTDEQARDDTLLDRLQYFDTANFIDRSGNRVCTVASACRFVTAGRRSSGQPMLLVHLFLLALACSVHRSGHRFSVATRSFRLSGE